MRLKQYINESDVYLLLERLEIRHTDKDIRKISNTHYTFNIDDIIYDFYAEDLDFGDIVIYNVYFTSSESMIKRHNKFDIKDTYNVFNKIITCLILFINDQKPISFTFSTDDPKLSKIYKVIIMKIRKHKPFNEYKINNIGDSFTFTHIGYNQFNR